MLKHRILLAIITVLLIFFTVKCIKYAKETAYYRESAREMLTAQLGDFTIDFTNPGTHTFALKHSNAMAGHGIMLYIEKPVFGKTNQPFADAFESAEIDIELRNAEKSIVKGKNINIKKLFFSDDVQICNGREFIPFITIPCPLRAMPFGDSYSLIFDIKNPASDSELTNCHIIAKYNWCGMELFIPKVYSTITVILLLAALICLFFFSRLLRVILVSIRKPTGDGILYLLNSYPKWSENFLRLDIRYLKEHGLKIHLVAINSGDCEMQEDWPQAKILFQGQTSTPKKDISNLAVFKSLRANFSLLKNRKIVKAIVNECRENNICHIHAEFADLPALLAAEAARKTGCTYSVGIHASDIYKMKYPPSIVFGEASFITVCNQAAAKTFFNSYGNYKEKLHIIHHGIVMDNWKWIDTIEIKPTIEILFAGRFVEKKGLNRLLEAIDILVNHAHNDVHLTVIGTGPLEEEMKQLAIQLDIASKITWTGKLTRAEMHQFFQHGTCLCAPCINAADGDMDGVPNVILEAMACGLPVIASQAGSLSEVVTEETAWPVANVDIPANIADAILDMASQPQETDRRRKNARNLVEYRFDARKQGERRSELFVSKCILKTTNDR